MVELLTLAGNATIFSYTTESTFMSKREKLTKRLLSKPKDFTWDELESLLNLLGYKKARPGRSSGSRRRFMHATMPPIVLHQPHPSNVLKQYQMETIIEALEKEGIL